MGMRLQRSFVKQAVYKSIEPKIRNYHPIHD